MIGVQELDKPKHIMRKNGLHKAPYPWFFLPTLHRYRLDQPSKWSEPRTIFVCSMADLFGKWVPDEWITEVFRACDAAPRHRYMFLTKNPKRYAELRAKDVYKRQLKESICTNEQIDSLTAFEETVFYRLIVNCDDFGRFDGRISVLKGRMFPLKEEKLKLYTLEKAMKSLVRVGLVELYKVEGRPLSRIHIFCARPLISSHPRPKAA